MKKRTQAIAANLLLRATKTSNLPFLSQANNWRIAIISLFLLSVFHFELHAQRDPKALQILEAMSKKYKSIPAFEANISQTLVNDVENIKEEFSGKITVKGNKFRLVLPEQEVINNGAKVWTYLPEANEVTVDDYDPSEDDANPTKIYEIYKKGFKYVYVREKTDGGVACDEIDLIPEKKGAQFFKIKMLISKKDKSIHNWTMFDKSGNKYHYAITKFNPTIKVDDSFFTFDVAKHPGVEEI